MTARYIWQLRAGGVDELLIPPAGSDRGVWSVIERCANALADAAREVTLLEAREYAIERVVAEGTLKPLSVARMLPYWARFELYAERRDGIRLVSEVTQDCVRSFIEARSARGQRPGKSSMALRRTSLRTWFRILRHAGLMVGDVTLDMETVKRDVNHARGLTDEEMDRVRTAATSTLFTDRPALSVALLEAGA